MKSNGGNKAYLNNKTWKLTLNTRKEKKITPFIKNISTNAIK